MADEIDRENEQFNKGVLHAVDLLAKWLEVTDYVGADGSEDYDTDLANTMLNILAAKGLLDRDEHVFATLPASHPQAPASGEALRDAMAAEGWKACEECAALVLLVNEPASGFLATCGRRLATVNQCRAGSCAARKAALSTSRNAL